MSNTKSYKWMMIQPLIGGCAIGAERAFGSKPVCVIDYQGIANSELYMAYQKEQHNTELPHFIFNGNFISKVMEFETEEMTEQFNALNKDIDFVVAVPVCSGLSGANSTGQGETKMGSDAIQNNNQLGITEFTLKNIKPKAYIYENAPGLFGHPGDKLRDVLEKMAYEAGYNISFECIDTLNYGLPQKRKRTFCIFWRKDVFASCPEFSFEQQPRETLKEFFARQPDSPDEAELRESFEHRMFVPYLKAHYGGGDDWFDKWNEEKASVYDLLIENDEWEMAKNSNPEDKALQHHVDHVKAKLAKGMGWYSNDNYNIEDDYCGAIYWRTFNQLVNPFKKRILSRREGMRLMGMPDDYPYPENFALIGQNVPVNTAYTWCNNMVKAIEGQIPASGKTMIMQNLSINPNKNKEQVSTKINKFIK